MPSSFVSFVGLPCNVSRSAIVWFKMANPADSEAHFDERARAYQLPNGLLQELKLNGIRTLGHLAFAIFRPGADFDETAFNQWARDLNHGVAPTMGALAALRRLHFESEVVLTAALKASVETTEATAVKAIPVAERAARLAALRNRLAGVNIHGVGEPSHALVDEACHQFETRTLKYIEPALQGSWKSPQGKQTKRSNWMPTASR